MRHTVEARTRQLIETGLASYASDCLIGLEKESLRVSRKGCIAQTPHPDSLGSALTNAYITTDYSEALIELITPPMTGAEQPLAFLQDSHKFVYDHLPNDEILWATSMPCVIAKGESIPIAKYGSSNPGIMKTVYRHGLGHRYGRAMQVIAGVHFNFSFSKNFWPGYLELLESNQPLRTFTDSAYLGLLRNLQRFGWLIIYLFGASPALCKSFLGDKPSRFHEFDSHTYYGPFATSLRMSDFGYTNSKEKGVGIKANYNNLKAYVENLTRAITTPCPTWEKLGVVENGQYKQLNANILQIENEYYSSVRPKQIPQWLEKPTIALEQRGISYIELRSLDVNAYHALGINSEQLYFLKAFMYLCLLMESPPINIQEQMEIDKNLSDTANRGRDPTLQLARWGRKVKQRDWALELMQSMEAICEMLDAQDLTQSYTNAMKKQLEIVYDPEQTPSARMLTEMRQNGESFFQFAQRMSQTHSRYFKEITLSPQREIQLRHEAEASHQRQQALEDEQQVPFDTFLKEYFAQDLDQVNKVTNNQSKRK